MSFKGLRMLKIPKLPDFEKYWKSSKNIQRGDPWKKNFFSFLFNTLFYTRQPYKTIRMSFGGLRMLKSPKLTQCYPFASVALSYYPWNMYTSTLYTVHASTLHTTHAVPVFTWHSQRLAGPFAVRQALRFLNTQNRQVHLCTRREAGHEFTAR